MLAQIEITTHCNYECFYCAGRAMPQQHMGWDDFLGILARLPAPTRAVSLQGEGEPTTHPRFWEMAREVAQRGWLPTTISNGSHLDIDMAARWLADIGISLDTVDADEATRIGRYKLHKVLPTVERLLAAVGPRRLFVITTDYGQPLAALRHWLAERGIRRHLVQPLQSKEDYAGRYRDRAPLRAWRYHYRCRYIEAPSMRFFDLAGTMMPCCFIKDTRRFASIEAIAAALQAREVPACCQGCREITLPPA